VSGDASESFVPSRDVNAVPHRVAPDSHEALGRVTVELLCGATGELTRGAETAVHRHLAGLFLFGLSTMGLSESRLPPEVAEAIRRQARREAADDAVSARETGEILEILEARGHRPVALKGRIVALEFWPRPYYRPPGDLDLLLEEDAVRDAAEALSAVGYQRAPAGRHAETTSATLWPPEGRGTAVDLHWRLSKIVGSGIDPKRLLRRARPARLDGHLVRELDRADQLLFLLVHAAKHGLRGLKWVLDLYAVAMRTPASTWRLAAQRAVAAQAARPCHLSGSFLATLPGLSIDKEMLTAVTPNRLMRGSLARMVTLQKVVREDPVTFWEKYVLKILLEESLWARIQGAGRLIRRNFLDPS